MKNKQAHENNNPTIQNNKIQTITFNNLLANPIILENSSNPRVCKTITICNKQEI